MSQTRDMFYSNKDLQLTYEKHPELNSEDVRELAKWTLENPHLPQITELQAILFLHSCYYNLDKAKITVENYFTFRTKNFELFSCPDKETIKRTMNTGFMKVMPNLTPDGHAVIFVKILDCDASKYNFLNEIKVWTMIFTLHLHQFGIFKGVIVVYDMKGYSLKHLFKSNIFLVKKILNFVQVALPVRIQGIHFFNSAFGSHKIMRILKPFLSRELCEMFMFHGGVEGVLEHVPRSCLPGDYGGDLPSVTELNEETAENVFGNWDFFLWHENQKVVDSRMPLTDRNNNNNNNNNKWIFW